MRASLKLLPLGLLLACGVTDPTAGPYGYYCPPQGSSDAFPTSRPSFPSQSSQGNFTDDWAWLATHTPGCWAGAYVEPASGTANSYNLVLLLVDTTQLAGAIDSLRVYEPSLLTQTPGVVSIVSIRAQQAHWSLLQLYEWFQYAQVRFQGWTAIGIDFRGNRVLLGVGSSADSVTALGLLGSWHAPPDLFELELAVICDCEYASTCC